MEAIAASLSKVHALVRYTPAPAARPPAGPAGVRAAGSPRAAARSRRAPASVRAEPAAALRRRWSQAPAPCGRWSRATPQRAQPLAPARLPARRARRRRASQRAPAPARLAPARAGRRSRSRAPSRRPRPSQARRGTPSVDVELGIHSTSNFYKGLGGNDVIEHGGIFVATYKILKIGAPVTPAGAPPRRLRVHRERGRAVDARGRLERAGLRRPLHADQPGGPPARLPLHAQSRADVLRRPVMRASARRAAVAAAALGRSRRRALAGARARGRAVRRSRPRLVDGRDGALPRPLRSPARADRRRAWPRSRRRSTSASRRASATPRRRSPRSSSPTTPTTPTARRRRCRSTPSASTSRAPDDLSAIGDYDDWYTELVTHEYTHIAHTDNISGVPALVNAVLGKTLAPNQVQPRWILEGLAVVSESEHTSGGRIRSNLFDMYLRADVLEGRIAGLDQFSTTPTAGRRATSGTSTARASCAGSPTCTARTRCARSPPTTARRPSPGASTARSAASPGAPTSSSTRASRTTSRRLYAEQMRAVEARGLREGTRHHAPRAHRVLPALRAPRGARATPAPRSSSTSATTATRARASTGCRSRAPREGERREELVGARPRGRRRAAFTPAGDLVFNSVVPFKNYYYRERPLPPPARARRRPQGDEGARRRLTDGPARASTRT